MPSGGTTVHSTPKAEPLFFQLPILYKKTNTGAIQMWRISVTEASDSRKNYQIWTTYGQVSGKMQETVDTISEGKNIGKKNETSIKQQAEAEATAKWEKQKKKGYVESKEGAEAGELDDLIEGGVVPMLAESYMDVIYDLRPGHENEPPQYVHTKESKKIKFPCRVQPKLDGIRCIAIIQDGKCTLWSRTRKPINSVPHIIAELEAAFANRNIILDGELYNHEMKHDFEKIVSLVRQKKPAKGHEIVQYHVYDLVNDETFEERTTTLDIIFAAYNLNAVKPVDTEYADTEEEALQWFESFVKLGYEGAMLRNEESLYVNKRSMDLQKIKPFTDDEFNIIGVTEGRGKMAGHAIFVCLAKNGKEFEAKLKGALENLKPYFENESTWKGKRLTVRYQGLTNKEKVPRFPVGIAVRDYE
jgi:DNA ligase 1